MSRNGNNLSQVLVANAVLSNNEAMSALASAEVGIYRNGTNTSDGAASDVYIDATVATNPQWIPHTIQLAQGRTSGNPLATPLIKTADITRLDFTLHAAPAKAGNCAACAAAGTETISNTNNSTRFAIKAILKAVGPVTNYTEYTDPSYKLNDRVGEVRNYEYTSDASATAAEICQGLVDAINADDNAFITAALANTSDFSVSAKDHGTVYQLIDDSDTAITVSAGAVGDIFTTHVPTEGVGMGWQVIDDEKKCQGKYGHQNRLWLPKTAETFGNSTWAYHRLDIQYRHNWPNSTGIAPSGELNTVRMYIGDSATAMVHGDTILDSIFLCSATGTLASTTHIFHN